MRSYRVILITLLISGVILILFVSFFLLSLFNSRKKPNKGFDTQTPPSIDNRINTGALSPTPEVAPIQDKTDAIDIDREVDESQRRNNPDVYIYNRVPFENQYFRIEGTLRQEGNPDFSFTVTLKGQGAELSKTKLIEWLKELGLTGEQTTSLLIEYR